MPLSFVVPQSHCVVLERFGKFARTCREGLHFKLPFFEHIRKVPEWGTIANKDGWKIELTEQQTDTPARQCHTKDNVRVQVDASVYWRVVDPRKALYEVDNLPKALTDLALNALRTEVGGRDMDSLLSERDSLNQAVAASLLKVTEDWGVHITRTEIQELETTDETAAAMRQQMEAERKRRAAVSEASGEAEAEVTRAKAEKEAAMTRAEGRAQALQTLAEAEGFYLSKLREYLDAQSAARVLAAQKFLDGFDVISRNPAHKVFLPNTTEGVFTSSAADPSVHEHAPREAGYPNGFSASGTDTESSS